MTDRYVRSTTGSNGNSGASWALAKATIAGGNSVALAGDRIFISQVHAENTASTINITASSTQASPAQWICGNDGAQPPTAVAATATATCTGSSPISIRGYIYCYGISWTNGDTGSPTNIIINDNSNYQTHENSNFTLGNTGAASAIQLGATLSITKMLNCGFKFAATTQAFTFGGTVHINGGSILAGSSTPGALVLSYNTQPLRLLIENFDFSNLGTGFDFFASPQCGMLLTVRNCKLPASWAGNLLHGSISSTQGAGRLEMFNCDSGATNYRRWTEDQFGTVRDEETHVRTGGASDGTTPFSWKLTTRSGAQYPLLTLASPEFVIWNDVTGVSRTATVEILWDSATAIKNSECYLEVSYLGDSSTPQGSYINDEVADLLTAAVSQASSAASWDTTGMSNPNPQKLSVTFTPRMKGPIYARVILLKASTTIYVDPLVTLS